MGVHPNCSLPSIEHETVAVRVFEWWGSAPNWGRYGGLKIGVLALKIGIFANFDPVFPENWRSDLRLLDSVRQHAGPSVDAEN